MALSDLYNSGRGAATPSPIQGAVNQPQGPSSFRGLGAWLSKRVHFLTLALGLLTGAGFFAVRLTSSVPTDAAIFSAVASANRQAPGDALEGVADVRIGSCRRQLTDDRAGDAAEQWSCGLSYTYIDADTRVSGSQDVAVLRIHADGRAATKCLDCGPPLHFIERGAPDRLKDGQFVHLPSEGKALAYTAPVVAAPPSPSEANVAEPTPPVPPPPVSDDLLWSVLTQQHVGQGTALEDVEDVRISACRMGPASGHGTWPLECTLSLTYLANNVRFAASYEITFAVGWTPLGSPSAVCKECGPPLDFVIHPDARPLIRKEGKQVVHYPAKQGGSK